MAERDAVVLPGRQDLYDRNHYSPAVRSGGFLFVSGQVGSLPDGSAEADAKAQVRLAFTNLLDILAAAGCSFADVVDVTMYIVDPEANAATVIETMSEFWGPAPYPALTAVGVTWLSGFLFEIKVMAKLPEGSGNG